MHNFKVGDIVIGSRGNTYGTTKAGTTWKVLKLQRDGQVIQIGPIDPSTDPWAIPSYDVNSNQFELYEKGKALKPTAYKPLYPEVFVYKNNNLSDSFTVLDAITGEHIEDLDDIILFNCVFNKKINGKRGIKGMPSYNYNEHIADIMYLSFEPLEYKSTRFNKPHYVNGSGQPTKVGIVYIKNNKIGCRYNGFKTDNYIKMYLNDKLKSPVSQMLNTDEAVEFTMTRLLSPGIITNVVG